MTDEAVVYFDSLEAASEGLLRVLTRARSTRENFEFGPIETDMIMRIGLTITGDVDKLLEDLLKVPGAVIAN